jgi:hypothetical protein
VGLSESVKVRKGSGRFALMKPYPLMRFLSVAKLLMHS